MTQAAARELENGLVRRWQEYRSLLRACRHDLSEIAVHDLRVSARRMLGALDVVRGVRPRPRVRKIRRTIKGVLDALDDLRDVQVMSLELSQTPESVPQPAELLARLQGREKRLLGRARRQLDAVRPSGLRKRIRKLRAALRENSEGGDGAAFQAVDALFRKVIDTASQLDEQDPTSIHRARIAFKRFRYAVEMVQPLLPELPPDQLSRMHAYQSRLGDIRDLDILLATLARSSRKPGAAAEAPGVDVQYLNRYYEDRRAQLITAYREGADEPTKFWRGAPEQPFPWEANNDPLYHPPRDRRPSRSGGR